MTIVKKHLKKVLGLVSIGMVIVGVAVGISVKDKNNSAGKLTQVYNSKSQDSTQDAKNSQRKTICRNVFEENEKDAILKGYREKDVVDCSFVGCGGLF